MYIAILGYRTTNPSLFVIPMAADRFSRRAVSLTYLPIYKLHNQTPTWYGIAFKNCGIA